MLSFFSLVCLPKLLVHDHKKTEMLGQANCFEAEPSSQQASTFSSKDGDSWFLQVPWSEVGSYTEVGVYTHKR